MPRGCRGCWIRRRSAAWIPFGVERVDGAWTESEPRVERHTTAGLQGTSVAVGVRDPDAPDGGILILPGPLGEPASWRTLLLEALVLADVAEPLAAK